MIFGATPSRDSNDNSKRAAARSQQFAEKHAEPGLRARGQV